MTADDQQIGKTIKAAFEQQINAAQNHVEKLNEMVSNGSIVNAQINVDSERLAFRKKFDSQVESYYKSTQLTGEKITEQTHVQFNKSIIKVSVIPWLQFLSFYL